MRTRRRPGSRMSSALSYFRDSDRRLRCAVKWRRGSRRLPREGSDWAGLRRHDSASQGEKQLVKVDVADTSCEKEARGFRERTLVVCALRMVWPSGTKRDKRRRAGQAGRGGCPGAATGRLAMGGKKRGGSSADIPTEETSLEKQMKWLSSAAGFEPAHQNRMRWSWRRYRVLNAVSRRTRCLAMTLTHRVWLKR